MTLNEPLVVWKKNKKKQIKKDWIRANMSKEKKSVDNVTAEVVEEVVETAEEMPVAEVVETKVEVTAEPSDNGDAGVKISPEVFAVYDKMVKELEDAKAYSLRVQADFENFKKRNKSIAQDMYNEGVADAIVAILPVLDSFDRATESAGEKEKEGIELIKKQFFDTLSKFDIKEINSLGEDFDPNFHNAVMQVEVEDKSQVGKVVNVLQKGYCMGERILRYCMVQVGC